jgi:beta-xylosidase
VQAHYARNALAMVHADGVCLGTWAPCVCMTIGLFYSMYICMRARRGDTFDLSPAAIVISEGL